MKYEIIKSTQTMRIAHKIPLGPYSAILVTESPFGNCQMFTIGLAYKMATKTIKLTPLFKAIKEIVNGKSLMLIDIEAKHVEAMKTVLKPFTKTFKTTPYLNTNHSNMVICHVYLNDKYKNL